MEKIKKVIDYKLCLGCGLCQSVCPSKCEMQIDENGFYYPSFQEHLTKEEDEVLSEVCPSIHIDGRSLADKGYWGPVVEVKESWASDEDIRFHSASGGVTTALAVYLIENKIVDGVLQVKHKDDDWLHNELSVSRFVTDVMKCAQSRYAPALTLNRIHDILRKDRNRKYAFVGKPCDIAAIRNLQQRDSDFKNQIIVCLSIFCAGMPSYNATKKAWRESGRSDNPIAVRYRGDGWPGFFKAEWSDGDEFKLTYNESWGRILGRTCGPRCKVCPDGIGEFADISIGDAWHTKNGYPDFTEQKGRCFVMVRTEIGKQLFASAVESGYIVSREMNINEIPEMQPYQAARRKNNLWRMLPLQVKTRGLLKFKGMNIVRMGMKEKPVQAVKTLIGSFRRFF